jgi:hypothetical protein
MLDMKIERNHNPFIFLTTYLNLSYKSSVLDLFFFEIWQIWAIFSKRFFCSGENHIFQVKFCQNFAKTKSLLLNEVF